MKQLIAGALAAAALTFSAASADASVTITLSGQTTQFTGNGPNAGAISAAVPLSSPVDFTITMVLASTATSIAGIDYYYALESMTANLDGNVFSGGAIDMFSGLVFYGAQASLGGSITSDFVAALPGTERFALYIDTSDLTDTFTAADLVQPRYFNAQLYWQDNSYGVLNYAHAPTIEGGITSASIEGSFFSPTPEPAAWALMILGFGAVGGAMRSRRRAAFAA